MIVVPDASILLKWVLQRDDEGDLESAWQLEVALRDERVEIRVPTLWRYEVGNVLGLRQPALAKHLMEALLGYELDEVPLSNDYCLDVLRHMRELKGVTFYDAAYHVLALRVSGTCVTADARYVRRARHKGNLSLLSEWRPPRAKR